MGLVLIHDVQTGLKGKYVLCETAQHVNISAKDFGKNHFMFHVFHLSHFTKCFYSKRESTVRGNRLMKPYPASALYSAEGNILKPSPECL